MAFDQPFKVIFGVDETCDMSTQVDEQFEYLTKYSFHVSIFRMLSRKWCAKILAGIASWGSATVVGIKCSHSMNKFLIRFISLNLMRYFACKV